MSKKAGLTIFMAIAIVTLILSYVHWQWPGLITAALMIVLIKVSTEIEIRVQRKRDRETAREYGAYREVETSNYPDPDSHTPKAPPDKPST